MEASAAVVGRPRRPPGACLRRLHRLRLARQRDDPRRPPRGAPACAHALARRRHGAAGRARGGAGDDAAAGAHAGDGLLGRAARASPRRSSRCSTPGITPRVPELGSLGASGDLAPLAHCALVLIGEGEVVIEGDVGRCQPASSRHLEAKEGLALINGTDGMLGMLILALHDFARLLRGGGHHRRDVGRGAARHRPRVRRGPESRCGRTPARPPAPRTCVACSADSPIVASHRYSDDRVQDAYSLRCAPQVNGAARDTLAHAERVAPPSWRARSTTRWCCPTAASSRAATSTAPRSASRSTSSRSRWPRSARSPSDGPTGCSTPRARTGCRLSSPPSRASTPAS